MNSPSFHPSDQKTDRRATARRGMTRRLTFEAMEGRFMLSAASLASADTGLAETAIVAGATEATNAAGGATLIGLAEKSAVEGGYLSTQPRIAGQGNFAPTTLSSLDGLDFILNNGMELSAAGTFSFDGSDRDASGIADMSPVRFNVPLTGGQTNAYELAAANNAAPSVTQEGGAIPIETLRPGGGPFATPMSGSAIALALATSESTRSNAPSAPTAVYQTVNGETARAIVFAMAGGEPEFEARIATAGADPANGSPSTANRPAESPVSRIEAPVTDVTLSRGELDPASGSVARNSENGQASTNLPNGGRRGTVAGNLVVSSALLAVEQSDSAIRGEGVPAADGISVLPQMGPSAISQAFEQIELDAAAPGDSAIGDFLPHTLAATPLLVVWAMERIAATNSRRDALKVCRAANRR